MKKYTEETTHWTGKDWIYLAIVLALALGLRVVHLHLIQADPLFDLPLLDEKSYDDWAQDIAAGKGGERGVFFQSPLYPYFLGILYKFIGRDFFTIKLIQEVLGAFTCVFIFLLARMIYDRNWGFVAGLIAAIYAPFIYYGSLLLQINLALFFLALSLALTQWSVQRVKIFGMILGGLSFGFAILGRGNLILVVPFLLLGLYLYEKLAAWPLFFAIGLVIAIAPVTFHNLMAGEFVLITAQAGQNFFIGNNPHSDGASGRPPEIRRTPEFEKEDFHREAEKALGRELTQKEVSKYWSKQAWNFILGHPGQAAKLFFRKFLLLFGAREVPDNRDFNFYQRYSFILKNPLGKWFLLFPIGLIGIVMSFSRFKEFALLHALFWGYAASCIIFHVYSRYRQPLVIPLIIFAVYTLMWLKEQADIPQRKEIIIAAVTLVIGLVLVLNTAANYSAAQPHYNQGYGLTRKGQLQEAIEEYKKAIEIDPTYYEALNNLGLLYLQTDKIREAEDIYKQLVETNPAFAEGHLNYGMLLLKMDKLEQAEQQFKEAQNNRRDYFKAIFNLGNLYVMQDRTREAIFQFAKAEKLQPTNPKVLYSLAVLYEKMGDRAHELVASNNVLMKNLKEHNIPPDVEQQLKLLNFNQIETEEALEERVRELLNENQFDLYWNWIRDGSKSVMKNKLYGHCLGYWEKYIRYASNMPSEQKYVQEAKNKVRELKAKVMEK